MSKPMSRKEDLARPGGWPAGQERMAEWMAIEMREQALEQQAGQVEARACELEARIRALANVTGELDRQRERLAQEAVSIRTQRERIAAARQEILLEREAFWREGKPPVVRPRLKKPEKKPEIPLPAPAKDQGPDRRKSVHVSKSSEHTFWAGLTQDLNEGGLFLATYEDIPVGARIELALSVPGAQEMRVTGEVVWVREISPFTEDMVPGVGLRLVDLGKDERRAILDFFQIRPPLFYEWLE